MGPNTEEKQIATTSEPLAAFEGTALSFGPFEEIPISDRVLIIGTHAQNRDMADIFRAMHLKQDMAAPSEALNRWSPYVNSTIQYISNGERLKEAFFDVNKPEDDISLPRAVVATGEIRLDIGGAGSTTAISGILQNIEKHGIPLIKVSQGELRNLAEEARKAIVDNFLQRFSVTDLELINYRDLAEARVHAITGSKEHQQIEEIKAKRRELIRKEPRFVQLGDLDEDGLYRLILGARKGRTVRTEKGYVEQIDPREEALRKDAAVVKFRAGYDDQLLRREMFDRFALRGELVCCISLGTFTIYNGNGELTELGKLIEELRPLYLKLREMGYSHYEITKDREYQPEHSLV